MDLSDKYKKKKIQLKLTNILFTEIYTFIIIGKITIYLKLYLVYFNFEIFKFKTYK